MNFFKSVFFKDPNQPQNDDAPEPNLDPNPNPDPNLDSIAMEFWQIDQNNRIKIKVSDLDLPVRCREFGSGLKKETSVIREVTSCAVMDFLASVDAGASVP